MITVLIADDVKILRDCLKLAIEKDKSYQVIGTAKDGVEAVDLWNQFQPDVILMDLNMPIKSGLDAIQMIRKSYSATKILVLTSEGDEKNISLAIEYGADGYVLKDISANELLECIKSVKEGQTFVHTSGYIYGDENKVQFAIKENQGSNTNPFSLTKREIDVILLIAEGFSNEEIASRLEISEGRVRNIVADILSKCNVKNRTQLAVIAVKNYTI